MKKEVIYTDKAPEPGPYSQAIKYGNLIFVAGQTSEDPATNKAIHDNVTRQTERILSNIKAILESAGSGGSPTSVAAKSTPVSKVMSAIVNRSPATNGAVANSASRRL